MPLVALLVLAGVGIAYAVSQHPSPKGATPSDGPLPPPPGPHPLPPEPPPVVLPPSLKAGEAYHLSAKITLDPNADIASVLQAHVPAGLLPLTLPLLNASTGLWDFDGAWMGQDGTLLSSLSNAAIQFVGALDAGTFDPSTLMQPPPVDPGLDPGLLPPLPGTDPSQMQGMPDPGGGGGGGPIPTDFVPQPNPPPFPPGVGLPPPPHVVSFGPHPSGSMPVHPIQSFGPHATANSLGVQTARGGGMMRTAGSLSQYHPHAGSAFRHWPYDARPVPHLPPVPPTVAGTLSGYNPHPQDWNRYPLRRAGSGNGHQ